jgi:branched-chain amino acid transport system ATP-binding protein
VYVAYGNMQVLRGLSLEVLEGEITVAIGNNGAGKTTMLRTISGMVHPSSGKVLFEKEEISRLRPHEIVRMGIAHVPEGGGVFRGLSVQENLRIGAYVSRARKMARESMQLVHGLFPVLEEKRSHIAGTLSGGEQRMLAIAKALMATPRLLLVDEPSLGLAPMMVEKVMEGIGSIRNRGVTVLLVEQNARSALQMAHTAYVLDDGVVALHGSGADLLKSDVVRKMYLGA